jgi:hypothetical protein
MLRWPAVLRFRRPKPAHRPPRPGCRWPPHPAELRPAELRPDGHRVVARTVAARGFRFWSSPRGAVAAGTALRARGGTRRRSGDRRYVRGDVRGGLDRPESERCGQRDEDRRHDETAAAADSGNHINLLVRGLPTRQTGPNAAARQPVIPLHRARLSTCHHRVITAHPRARIWRPVIGRPSSCQPPPRTPSSGLSRGMRQAAEDQVRGPGRRGASWLARSGRHLRQ